MAELLNHRLEQDTTTSASKPTRLKITEIFRSIQGEAREAGHVTTFIRLTGCPLRCTYCDTAYAFYGGEWMTLDAVLQNPVVTASRYICVTGGEPLAQKNCRTLLSALCDAGHRVSLETSGAMSIEDIDPRVSRIVDIKTPDSGECERNLWANIALLTAHDQLKFVICSRADFDWAVEQVKQRLVLDAYDIWFSPSFSQIDPAELAQWVIESGLPIRFQLQLHKILWNDEPGR